MNITAIYSYGLSTFAAMVFLFTSSTSFAQVHFWSQRQGQAGFDAGKSVCVDNMGNVLLAGYYENAPDFVVLTKLDIAGNFLWEKKLSGTAGTATGVAVDIHGNVYVGGNFYGTIDLGGGPLVSVGLTDHYLAKFTAKGIHLWSRRFGTTAHDYVNGIAVGGDGSVVMIGDFNGDIDFGGGLVSASWWSTFVAKYDANGYFLWANTYSSGGVGSPSTKARGVAVDGAGNVVIAGDYWATANLGGANLTNAGWFDAFLAKYSATGVHLWSMGFGGPNNEGTLSVALDGTNPVICGYFSGTVSFGGPPLSSLGADNDGFVARYDTNGNHAWSRSLASGAADFANALSVDPLGNCLVTGSVSATPSFGGPVLPHIGGQDVFVVLLDIYGNHVWSALHGGIGNDQGEGACFDPWGATIVTGWFESSALFGGGVLTSAGDKDLFIAKYVPTATGVTGTPAITGRLSAFPNPFNPSTTIEYSVERAGPVTMQVCDVQGRMVEMLIDGVYHEPGIHRFHYIGDMASGVYLVRLLTPGSSESIRIVLLK